MAIVTAMLPVSLTLDTRTRSVWFVSTLTVPYVVHMYVSTICKPKLCSSLSGHFLVDSALFVRNLVFFGCLGDVCAKYIRAMLHSTEGFQGHLATDFSLVLNPL